MRASLSTVLRGLPVLVVLPVLSCGPLPDSRPRNADLQPPQVQSVTAAGPAEIAVTFDEPAVLSESRTRVTPALSLSEVSASGACVTLKGETQAPGRRYALESEARDASGNTASFTAEFYGYNGRVPSVLINEFTPRGSGSHPDAVELKCQGAGNLGGMVLYLGSPSDHDGRYVFPPLEVAAGTFIVLHLKPSGDPAEKDETTDPSTSGGADASPHAFDFWMKDSPGLPGNNGVLCLCDRPGGACLDAVVWSNRTSESDDAYGGFGSESMRARAREIASRGAWKAAGLEITPEDAVNPEGSTGTRSICRSRSCRDTNSAADWHIVPTRGASFGAENSEECYQPAAR